MTALFVSMLLMTACGSDDDANDAAHDDGTAGVTTPGLPAPEGAIGSVTGMPANPGPGTSRMAPIEPSAVGADDGGSGFESQAVAPQIVVMPPPGDVDATVATIVPDLPPVPRPPGPTAPTAPPGDALPAPPPAAEPTGTEAATESTTIIVEPADSGG
ncbi:MAG TPA: hypothetical protein VFM73_08410 [Xanthomonadaceae bacterium]|nr:hypothetical protein [Xanthomonadaceae bacterium]